MLFFSIVVPLVHYINYKRKVYMDSYYAMKKDMKENLKEIKDSNENTGSSVDPEQFSPGVYYGGKKNTTLDGTSVGESYEGKENTAPLCGQHAISLRGYKTNLGGSHAGQGDFSSSEVTKKKEEIVEKYIPDLFSYSLNVDKDKTSYNIERRCRLPRTLDEYYSYKTESRRGKEMSSAFLDDKKNQALHQEENKSDGVNNQEMILSDEDRDQCMADTWSKLYKMDRISIETSHKLIRLLTDTLKHTSVEPDSSRARQTTTESIPVS